MVTHGGFVPFSQKKLLCVCVAVSVLLTVRDSGPAVEWRRWMMEQQQRAIARRRHDWNDYELRRLNEMLLLNKVTALFGLFCYV
jgi:hypothetical protein